MVPLQDTHAANGVIEPDRVLFVSGLLDDSSFGMASCALFDGRTFIPYISSTAAAGNPGAAASLFRSLSSFSFSQRRKFSNMLCASTEIYLGQISWQLVLSF